MIKNKTSKRKRGGRFKGIKGRSKIESKKIAQEKHRKDRHYRVLVVVLVALGFLLVIGGAICLNFVRADKYRSQQEVHMAEVVADLSTYHKDYDKEVPKIEFEVEDLEGVKIKNDQIQSKKYDGQKREIGERIKRLEQFAEIRGQIEDLFRDGILRSDADEEKIATIRDDLGSLKESYREVLRVKFEIVEHQYQAIRDLIGAISGMFTDDGMKTVKEDLTREDYDKVKSQADSLPQRDIAEQYAEIFKQVDEALIERERIAEEERRKVEEEYRRRRAELLAAWRVLNVPYWSQNGEGVKNGCEVAALLMALQYKGYLGGMSLRTYAEMMPKSDDPFAGFRGDIFGPAGDDAPFWIAPAPLAVFGRESSGNPNVVDITGAGLDALDAEVAAGNPVVIYLTLGYVAPTAWRYGAPANLHVMLLTGYNSMTGVQRLTDPLTLNGKTYYDLPRSQVESILNATGNRAVVVR